MQYTIGIEELATNALIESIERANKRIVSFSQLDRYRDAIVDYLRENSIDVLFVFNNNLTKQFIHDCEDILDIKETPSNTYVALKDKFSANDLRKRFRIKLSLDVLRAFVSEEAIKILLSEISNGE